MKVCKGDGSARRRWNGREEMQGQGGNARAGKE